jgi:hypothetical protein
VKIAHRRRAVETHENNGPANRNPAFGDGVVGDPGSALGGALALNYA